MILNSWQKKWNIANDQPNANYNIGNEISYNTEVLKSNLWECNDAYILVKCNITIIGHQVTLVAFKSFAPFIESITKIDGSTIGDAEDLYSAMPLYNQR